MIIINQDKNEIINFGNVMNINVMDCKEEGYLISAGFIVGRDDNYRELGYYKTEERAKEVLQEITRQHSTFKEIKALGGLDARRFMGRQSYYNFDVYRMPED